MKKLDESWGGLIEARKKKKGEKNRGTLRKDRQIKTFNKRNACFCRPHKKKAIVGGGGGFGGGGGGGGGPGGRMGGWRQAATAAFPRQDLKYDKRKKVSWETGDCKNHKYFSKESETGTSKDPSKDSTTPVNKSTKALEGKKRKAFHCRSCPTTKTEVKKAVGNDHE